MVQKQIIIAVHLDKETVDDLMATYPAIIKEVLYTGGRTVFLVDITPQQETQIRPVLMDTLVKIKPIT